MPPRLIQLLCVTALGMACVAQSGEARLPDADAPSTPAQPEERRTATVVLQDGQVLTGELVSETDTQVILLISGVRTTIETTRIRERYIQPPIEERYKQIRDTIKDDDVEQLVQIAEWLLAKSRPDLAIEDLKTALAADPFHIRARELLVIAREAHRLQQSSHDKQNDDGDEPKPERQKAPPAHAIADQFPLITDDDVNIIRVYEIDLDNPPQMIIERSTMESVFEAFAGQPGVPTTDAGREAILQAPPVEQLELLFDLRAREFYGQVRVIHEPEVLRNFRDDVYRTWLGRGCATFRCHGGMESGRLRLPRSRATDPKVYLTAMLIVEAYRTSQGEPLIDFTEPASSLLLQSALPRHLSSHPHPEAPGWKPLFRSTTDGRFREGVAWIDALYTPRPDYPIDYSPPTAMEPGDSETRTPR